MSIRQDLQIVEETELIARLLHAPTIHASKDELFVLSQDDLKILLQSRTEAANLFKRMLESNHE